MTITLDSLFRYMHDIWWIVLLLGTIGAAVAIVFGIAMESMQPKEPEPPYRLEFDEFYVTEDKPRKE